MKVFITIGSNDTIAKPEVVDDLVSHLLEKCDFFDSEVNIVPKAKGNHNETFWASMFKPAYLWLFEGANYLKSNDKFNNYNSFDRKITAKVYPNPATTNISIETDAPTIKIIDEHGNFIKDVPIALPNRISFVGRGITINKVEVNGITKTVGDVNFDSVINKSLLVSSVPKGVGLLTVNYLMFNIIKAFVLQNNIQINISI
jgi:hypothetical protein